MGSHGTPLLRSGVAVMRKSHAVTSLVLVVALSSVASAGRLAKVWEANLTKAIGIEAGAEGFPVFAMRFSPAGDRLAVIVDGRASGGGERSRLIVLEVAHPLSGVREFEVAPGVNENESVRIPLSFGWSPSGAIVYAAGTIVSISSGSTCTAPSPVVFVTEELAIARIPAVPPSDGSSRIVFYNSECRQLGTWDVKENWLIEDVSTQRALLSVWRTINRTEAESILVDPLTRTVVRRWPQKNGWSGPGQFADNGRAICRGGNVWEGRTVPAVCWNVDTGQEIARTSHSNGTEPLAAAAGATRMTLSDYREQRRIFSEDGWTSGFKGRIAWDFGTGQELASWRPEAQTYTYDSPSGTKKITEPARFAMSPDGRCVAEGANGIVRLYRIEP
jgi:hypothetical protein